MGDQRTDFTSPNFDVDWYTKWCFKTMDEDAVKNHIQKIKGESDAAARELKTTVKQNFTNFIGISREIVSIENDILGMKEAILEMNGIIHGLQNISLKLTPSETTTTSSKQDTDDTLDQNNDPTSNLEQIIHELEIGIAEREWNKSVLIALKLQRMAKSFQDAKQNEFAQQWISELVFALNGELENPTCKLPQKKKIISLLIQLGFEDQAQSLFFRRHSRWIQIELRKLKFKGNIFDYVGELCFVVFSGIASAVDEYYGNFSAPSMSSTFIDWTLSEIKGLLDLFTDHVFSSQSTAQIEEAIQILKGNTTMLENKGLSIYFYVNELLIPQLISLLQKLFYQVEEVVSNSVQTETWDFKRYSLQGQNESSKKILNLTASAILFYEQTERLLSEIRRIICPELRSLVSTKLIQLFQNYMGELSKSISTISFDKPKTVVSILTNSYLISNDLTSRILLLLTTPQFDLSLGDLNPLKDNLKSLHPAVCSSFAYSHAVAIVENVLEWTDSNYSRDAEIDTDDLEPSYCFIYYLRLLRDFKEEAKKHLPLSVVETILMSLQFEILQIMFNNLPWETEKKIDQKENSSFIFSMPSPHKTFWTVRSAGHNDSFNSGQQNLIDINNNNNNNKEKTPLASTKTKKIKVGFGGLQQLKFDLYSLNSRGNEDSSKLVRDILVSAAEICSTQINDVNSLFYEWDKWCETAWKKYSLASERNEIIQSI